MAAFDTLPNIPDVPSTGNQEQDEFFRAVKETLEKMQGRDPSNRINERVLSEEEVKIRTSRDWPEARFQWVGGTSHLIPTTANIYKIPYNYVEPALKHTNPSYRNIDKWGAWSPCNGVITIPEDGIYYMQVRDLFYHGATAFVLQTFLVHLSGIEGFVATDPGPGTFTAHTTGWGTMYNTYKDFQATATGYETMHFSIMASLAKGDKIAHTVRSNVAIPSGSFFHANWSLFHIMKVRECGRVPNIVEGAGLIKENFIPSLHDRPNRLRGDNR